MKKILFLMFALMIGFNAMGQEKQKTYYDLTGFKHLDSVRIYNGKERVYVKMPELEIRNCCDTIILWNYPFEIFYKDTVTTIDTTWVVDPKNNYCIVGDTMYEKRTDIYLAVRLAWCTNTSYSTKIEPIIIYGTYEELKDWSMNPQKQNSDEDRDFFILNGNDNDAWYVWKKEGSYHDRFQARDKLFEIY
ncbi:MAG: hypothetical protein MJ211_07535 [Bacteroidales bacterium]|nr:hypothetical protein [Bacteroidales bacterium]